MPSVRDFMGNNPVIIGWTASGFTSKFLAGRIYDRLYGLPEDEY